MGVAAIGKRKRSRKSKPQSGRSGLQLAVLDGRGDKCGQAIEPGDGFCFRGFGKAKWCGGVYDLTSKSVLCFVPSNP